MTQEKLNECNNSDCISRQAAIDATWFEPSYTDPLNVLTEVRDRLKALPSAQPEVIRCGQCKYAKVADPEDSQDGYTCQFHRGSIWFSGSYCSWAERREENE